MVTRTKKIFVGGLSAPTTLEDVKSYFEQFGPVSTGNLLICLKSAERIGPTGGQCVAKESIVVVVRLLADKQNKLEIPAAKSFFAASLFGANNGRRRTLLLSHSKGKQRHRIIAATLCNESSSCPVSRLSVSLANS